MKTYNLSTITILKVTTVAKPNPNQEIIIAIIDLIKYLIKDK